MLSQILKIQLSFQKLHQKLDKLEANLDLDCKDYTTKLQKIEVIIKDKDERIKELESVLNKLIDQRHILE